MVIAPQQTPAAVLRTSIRLFLIIFMLTGAVFSGVLMAFYRTETGTRLEVLKTQEQFAVALKMRAISDLLTAISGDLLFFSQQNELTDYLDSGNPAMLERIGAEYALASKRKHIYDQIRFLDNEGMERVRVNYNQGAPVVVPAADLQSKKNRYYFEDCLQLAKGEIFISPFDLNIEQNAIEHPFKPMIRLGTPVFDAAGRKRGIVMVNYYGQDLLNKLLTAESLSKGSTMLLNADGYWLLSPNPDQAWGFMFKDSTRTLAAVDPAAWEQIHRSQHGQFETAVGLYTFTTVTPLKEGFRSSTGSGEAFGRSVGAIEHDAYQWHLLSFVSAQELAAMKSSFQVRYFSIGAGLFLLIATGAWVTAFAVSKRRLYQAQLQAMALYDALTGLPNRTLFFDRLTMTAEHSRRYNSRFGLLYIDLDGFKQVNDTLGHAAGDELLKAVGSQLLAMCRKSDTVARLGGDEFAILSAEIDATEAVETLAARIIAAFEHPIRLAAGEVMVGASIGIALFPADSDKPEDLVRLADTAMYAAKQQGKNRFCLAHALEPNKETV